ncbi:HupE/UreJ family protein [Parasalinivibrio latis]|uniref:HupE/UreJ family protein n=1 Tax=Parasalinivibrio latis TaxID=2952610 RepID=UPI0030E3DA73
MKMNRQGMVSVSAMLLTVPGVALAHTGAGSVSGFAAGFTHPVFGADHALAMLAVGIWAAQMSRGGNRHSLWIVPGAFVLAMAVGGMLAMSGVMVPGVEGGIALSVVLFGLLVAGAKRLPVGLCAATAGLFAVFHGMAHGAEMPLAANATSYAVGFMLATAMLHALGAGLVLAAHKLLESPVTGRLAGVAIAAGGTWLAFA